MKQVTCHGQRDPSSLTLPLQQRASKSFARREGLHGRAYEVRSVGSLCAARRSAPDWPTATEPIRPPSPYGHRAHTATEPIRPQAAMSAV